MRFNRFPSRAARQTGMADAAGASRSRVLWLACIAHALHDGYTDLIYVLLPVWQAEFGLDYAALALLRGLYAGTMASLQMLAQRLAQALGNRMTLALGTLLAGAGYALAGMSGGLIGLGAALAMSGAGSSTQHPLASSAVSKSFGRDARGALGVYNFSGDIGKAALPAAVALLVTLMPWRHALWIVSLAGCGVAAALALLMPSIPRGEGIKAKAHGTAGTGSGRGFALLLMTGVLDSAVRMGLLTMLPFVLQEKGASLTMVGTALSLVFIGGAAGKFACGWLGARIGVIGTLLATETGTAVCILAVLFSPLTTAMALLPLLGVMLNGTSSALYGTVPELARADRTERAFAIFYTGTIGSGALAPVIYGFLGDRIGVHGAVLATALTALSIVPLALALRPLLPKQ